MVTGRNAGPSVNGAGLVPVVVVAPLNCMMPATSSTVAQLVPYGALVQPLMSVNGVGPHELGLGRGAADGKKGHEQRKFPSKLAHGGAAFLFFRNRRVLAR